MGLGETMKRRRKKIGRGVVYLKKSRKKGEEKSRETIEMREGERGKPREIQKKKTKRDRLRLVRTETKISQKRKADSKSSMACRRL